MICNSMAGENDELVKSALVANVELAGKQGDFKRSLALLERLQSLGPSSLRGLARSLERDVRGRSFRIARGSRDDAPRRAWRR